ncbi:MAG TPA: nuclear transport factor 2 family protein [Candidatus Binatia bacterium]
MDSLNSHRWAQIGPLLEPSGTYEDPIAGGPLAATMAGFYWAGMWTRFPELRFAVQRVTGDGSEVVVEWTVDGIPGVTPAPSGVFVLRLRGNSIVSVRGYYNALPFLFNGGKSALVR